MQDKRGDDMDDLLSTTDLAGGIGIPVPQPLLRYKPRGQWALSFLWA